MARKNSVYVVKTLCYIYVVVECRCGVTGAATKISGITNGKLAMELQWHTVMRQPIQVDDVHRESKKHGTELFPVFVKL